MLPRNYKSKNIDHQFNRLTESIEGNTYYEKRKSALKKKIKTENETKRVIVAFEYNPRLPNINNIVRKHHRSTLFKNEDLKEDLRETSDPVCTLLNAQALDIMGLTSRGLIAGF